MNLLLTIAETIKVEIRPPVREMLQDVHTRLSETIDAFCKEPGEQQLIALNGAWARATYILTFTTPVPDPMPPRSNVMREAA